jgi:hypothetical protein
LEKLLKVSSIKPMEYRNTMTRQNTHCDCSGDKLKRMVADLMSPLPITFAATSPRKSAGSWRRTSSTLWNAVRPSKSGNDDFRCDDGFVAARPLAYRNDRRRLTTAADPGDVIL